MTDPNKMHIRALAVNRTWGRECDTLLYFSSATFAGLRVVVTDVGENESRDTLWRKAQIVWKYLIDKHIDE